MPAEQPDSVGRGQENGGRKDGRGNSARQPGSLGGYHHRQRRCQVKTDMVKPTVVRLALVTGGINRLFELISTS